MSCTVGDEVIYLNDDYEDGASPDAARKGRFDFTHTIKIRPKTPMRREAVQLPYGEYGDMKLDVHLDPLNDAYLVRITDETDKTVYERAINAGSILGLSIDISSYARGRYTVIVENSREYFTGTFDAQLTGIDAMKMKDAESSDHIYNLQGQRLSSVQKGVNIVNRQKVYIK